MCTNILLYKANVIYIYKGIRERTFIPRTAKTSIPLFMSLYFHFDYVYLSKKRGAGAGGGGNYPIIQFSRKSGAPTPPPPPDAIDVPALLSSLLRNYTSSWLLQYVDIHTLYLGYPALWTNYCVRSYKI